jgi:hypothetical protein
MKTTNAKAFQTPAPQQETSKPVKTNKRPSTTRKLRQATPSPAVIQADHDRLADDDEDRDIEYMPPKPTRKILQAEIVPAELLLILCLSSSRCAGWHYL